MTIAGKGFRATNVPAHKRTRSAVALLCVILATGGCSKQDGAPPPEGANATTPETPVAAPVQQVAASQPSSIPEPFHGTWVATADACQLDPTVYPDHLSPMCCGVICVTTAEIRFAACLSVKQNLG